MKATTTAISPGTFDATLCYYKMRSNTQGAPMRAVSLAFLFTCGLAAGCGGGNTSADAAKNPDLSTPGNDLRVVLQPDLLGNTSDLSASADMRSTGSSDLRSTSADLSGGGDLLAPAGAQVTVGPVVNTMSFSPDTVTIKAGQSVTWSFATSGHNVVAATQLGDLLNTFCSPNNMNCTSDTTEEAVGATYSFTFATAGTYYYTSNTIQDQGAFGFNGTVIVN